MGNDDEIFVWNNLSLTALYQFAFYQFCCLFPWRLPASWPRRQSIRETINPQLQKALCWPTSQNRMLVRLIRIKIIFHTSSLSLLTLYTLIVQTNHSIALHVMVRHYISNSYFWSFSGHVAPNLKIEQRKMQPEKCSTHVAKQT